MKRINDFQLLNTLMKIQNLKTYTISSSVKQLCQDMQLIKIKKYVISQVIKSKVMIHFKNSVLHDINFVTEKEHE